MPMFTPTPNGIAPAEGDGTATGAELTDDAGLGDPSAGPEDGEDQGEPTDTVVGITGVKAHTHTRIHPCRRVLVTVNFAAEHKARRFVPTATIQAVRRWAVGSHGFDLPDDERPGHEVGVCGTGAVADRNDRIGALATRCALCLDLAPRDRFQG